MASATKPLRIDERVPFWRNVKVIEVLIQVAFVVGLILLFWFLYTNMTNRLAAAGRSIDWNFLSTAAGFEIGEGMVFSPQESYGRAFVVGMVNTLRVAVVGIILATTLGTLAGIARLSSNWLVSRLAAIYVEVVRSTPLLVQLFFWYFGVILALPNVDAAQTVPGFGFLTNRGLYLNSPQLSSTGLNWRWWLLAALILAIVVGWVRRRQLHRQGRIGSGLGIGLATFVGVALLSYILIGFTSDLPSNVAYTLDRGDRGRLYQDINGNGAYDRGQDDPLRFVLVTLEGADGSSIAQTRTNVDGEYRFYDLPEDAAGEVLRWKRPAPLVIDRPQRQGFNFSGGLRMTPEFAGLLLGLVIYTGAFIAEIVRAGINAVPKGQWEASRAVGLRPSAIMTMIVLPQALRVIIPPLTNQYLNLTKNSSLAVAIGYPDLFNVSLTILNQTGAEVQMFVMILLTYLAFSLITSLLMNWYNRAITISER